MGRQDAAIVSWSASVMDIQRVWPASLFKTGLGKHTFRLGPAGPRVKSLRYIGAAQFIAEDDKVGT